MDFNNEELMNSITISKICCLTLAAVLSSSAAISFTDYSIQSGIQSTGFDSPWDVAVGDINNDGFPEIYCMSHVQGTTARVSKIYQSSATLALADITAAAFANVTATGGGQGVMMADLNADGNLDLLTGSNDGVGCIFKNQGNGTFVFYSGFPSTGYPELSTGHFWAREICLGDMDGDGYLDLINSHCTAAADIYWNNGSGVYAARTVAFPLTHGSQTPYKIADPIACDLDNDGSMDIASQRISCFATWPDSLPLTVDFWKNDGHGIFTWVSGSAGLDSGGEQSAFLVGDFENKGSLDIVQLKYPNQGPSKFFLNDGTGHFSQEAASRGLGAGSAYGTYYMKGVAGDFDNDGDLDILYSGDIWTNDGSGHFTKSKLGFSRAGGIAAVADLDNDGDLDVAGPYSDSGGFYLYRNNTDNNSWLKVRVNAGPKNPFGVGAAVSVYNGTNLIGYRQVICASAMQQPLEQHFGLGPATTVRVVVRFPGGKQKEITGVTAGRQIVVDTSGAAVSLGTSPVNRPGAGIRICVSQKPFASVVTIQVLGISKEDAPDVAVYDLSGAQVARLNTDPGSAVAVYRWNTRIAISRICIVRLQMRGRVYTQRFSITQ
jgi:hypothetical protein